MSEGRTCFGCFPLRGCLILQTFINMLSWALIVYFSMTTLRSAERKQNGDNAVIWKVYAGIAGLAAVVTFFGFYGVINRLRNPVKGYGIWTLIMMILATLATAYQLYNDKARSLGIMIGAAIGLAFEWYYCLAIYRFYQTLPPI